MAAKAKIPHIYGMEIIDENAGLARMSVQMNDLLERIKVVTGDICEASATLGREAFDCVTANPPYMQVESGKINPDEIKAVARHEVLCKLEDVIREASALLKQNGHFYMVHRPFRLSEALRLMHEYKVEAKRLRLVYPFADKPPSMMLVEGVKGAREELKIEAPLVIYKKQGIYTDEVLRIYGKIPKNEEVQSCR